MMIPRLNGESGPYRPGSSKPSNVSKEFIKALILMKIMAMSNEGLFHLSCRDESKCSQSFDS